jgi:hypothetical protein
MFVIQWITSTLCGVWKKHKRDDTHTQSLLIPSSSDGDRPADGAAHASIIVSAPDDEVLIHPTRSRPLVRVLASEDNQGLTQVRAHQANLMMDCEAGGSTSTTTTTIINNNNHLTSDLNVDTDLFSRELTEILQRKALAARLDRFHSIHSVGTNPNACDLGGVPDYSKWYLIGQTRGCSSASTRMCS